MNNYQKGALYCVLTCFVLATCLMYDYLLVCMLFSPIHTHIIFEPNIIVLFLEVVMCSLSVVMSFIYLIKLLRS